MRKIVFNGSFTGKERASGGCSSCRKKNKVTTKIFSKQRTYTIPTYGHKQFFLGKVEELPDDVCDFLLNKRDNHNGEEWKPFSEVNV